MTPSDGPATPRRWLTSPRGFMVLAVVFLFALVSWSFLVASWGPPACGASMCDVPIQEPANATGSVTGTLFGSYPILVVVIGLVLASCMIGGVYLAKMEGGPRP